MDWFVITGGPSSGISVTADCLAALGYHTVPEAARVLIDSGIAKGRTLEEIRRDELAFQERVLEMKLEIEKKAPRDRVVFFQRGIPDTLGYYRLLGVDSSEIMGLCKACRYKKVFVLENLPYKQDYARTEGPEKARLLGRLILEAYRELGFPVVRIPVKTIEERAGMIVNEIERG